ncbi:MAG: helix-turn-helix domain-containing protein [Paludibacterium sp.]|uniref:GlxA family transcriptional regulator n=1 Tax=Paludibacterium sp. TaxID=1917523 RepID=UPI0025F39087|nr:helix-turn-helix domain-containing protein [Paludibacterium sp.]MBV8049354.1 helix-turn-helix domain-containing protein [Paludibacterium sp.]
MHDIAVLLTEECFAGSVTGLLDALVFANRQAARHGDAMFRWQVLSPDGAAVRSSSGVRLMADGDFSQAEQADTVIVAPVYFQRLAAFEARLACERDLYRRLRRWHGAGKRVASMCSGVALLAESGLLEQRAATISWWLIPWFRARYPAVRLQPYAMLTEADGLLCGGATTAYLDLALRLVEQQGGAELARACARIMLSDRNRDSQAPYASQHDIAGHGDDLVLRCQQWLSDHLDTPYRLAQLAQAARVSERTVMRRFQRVLGQTPLGYLQHLRLNAARELLETTALGLDDISAQVGYGDSGTFRRLFRRELQCSPAEYRRRFGKQEQTEGP